jgi:hypothetical protein
MTEAPKWRVAQKSFIDHSLVEEDTQLTWTPPSVNGNPPVVGENLVPLNAAAQAIVDGQAKPHEHKTKKADPFDHDGDGKPGGSRPRKARQPASGSADKAGEPEADDLA